MAFYHSNEKLTTTVSDFEFDFQGPKENQCDRADEQDYLSQVCKDQSGQHLLPIQVYRPYNES